MKHHPPYEQCVVGVYRSFATARQAVEALEKANYPHDQVSLITQNVEQEAASVEELQYGDKSGENAAKGAGIGGLVGALLGAPLLTIPGLGLVVVAGPIGMAMAGAIVGTVLGALSGWGIHEDHAREYEEYVREGHYVVIADGNPQQVAIAEEIMEEQTEAERVDLHARTADDSAEIDDRPEALR